MLRRTQQLQQLTSCLIRQVDIATLIAGLLRLCHWVSELCRLKLFAPWCTEGGIEGLHPVRCQLSCSVDKHSGALQAQAEPLMEGADEEANPQMRSFKQT